MRITSLTVESVLYKVKYCKYRYVPLSNKLPETLLTRPSHHRAKPLMIIRDRGLTCGLIALVGKILFLKSDFFWDRPRGFSGPGLGGL